MAQKQMNVAKLIYFMERHYWNFQGIYDNELFLLVEQKFDIMKGQGTGKICSL